MVVFMKFPELTKCEKMVMKCIWRAEKDINAAEIRKALKEKYQKDYAPTTISTFLFHLTKKAMWKIIAAVLLIFINQG